MSDTITSYSICRKASFLFEKCGMTAQKAFADAIAQELYKAIRERLIDEDTMIVKGNTQCGQAMALYYGIFKGGERKAAYERLLELIHEADDHFNCGMVGVRVLFRVLADFGDASLAYKMITRTDFPSYGIWIDKFHLTSLPESFHDTVDGRTTSLNHHFMGDISGFFIKYIAGLQINPYRDDPTFVRVAPSFIDALDNAEAYYDTVGGRIDVMWEREKDAIKLTVSKADGVKGEVLLPTGYVFFAKDNAEDMWMNDRRDYKLENTTYYIKKIR